MFETLLAGGMAGLVVFMIFAGILLFIEMGLELGSGVPCEMPIIHPFHKCERCSRKSYGS
jgi:hypothetical protein